MVSTALVVRSILQVLEQVWAQQTRTREIRGEDGEQAPAALGRVRPGALVVGRLLHDLAVHLVPQLLVVVAVLKIRRKKKEETLTYLKSNESLEKKGGGEVKQGML